MASKEAQAIFEEGKVVISCPEDADSFLQSGYGFAQDDKKVVLSPWEALYLLAKNRLKICDGDAGEELNFQSLLSKFRSLDDDVWIKYLIYRDLRSRGYVVRDGVGLGIDFRLYSRGTYGEKAAKYMVFAICEGSPISVRKIQEILSVAQNMKKQLIIAVMDRRGEIVYYSLSQFNLF